MTAAGRFFDENATTVSATTRKGWSSTLRRLERRHPTKRVNEITSADLKDFILHEDDGRNRTVAEGTQLNWRTCFRSFFSWCEYAGVIDKDPSSVLTRTVKLKARPVRAHTWMSESEIDSILDVCRNDKDYELGLRDAVALGFGIFTGLRLHEIAKMRWADLNLRTGTLSVLGKGRRLAQLPMPPQLVELLLEWQRLYAAGLGHPVGREQPVLIGWRNGPGSAFGESGSAQPAWGRGIGDSAVYTIIKERGAEVGIPELAPHDLRRSYAGILEDRGVPLREISALLRHSSIATTEKYLADNPKKWKDSVSSAFAGIGRTA